MLGHKGTAVRSHRLNHIQRKLVAEFSKSLLQGVGQLPSAVEQFEYAIHYRRAITDDEWKGLPEAWCAIPAVHQAGRGLVLEENT